MSKKAATGPTKRVITPNRREQNRIAQRNWRAKRRSTNKGSEPLEGDSCTVHGAIDSSAEASATSHQDQVAHRPIALPTDLLDARSHWMTLDDPFTAMFSALLYNGFVLNFDLTQLSSCSPTILSPLYNPTINMADDPSLILERVSARLPLHLPETLRPTLSQVLIPHHPALDLVPIPALRENALRLSAAMPHQPILWLMKLDIYQRSGVSISKEDRKRDGTMIWPWEEEAWKVEPWFRSKWLLAMKDV